jgi:hypothetical protein
MLWLKVKRRPDGQLFPESRFAAPKSDAGPGYAAVALGGRSAGSEPVIASASVTIEPVREYSTLNVAPISNARFESQSQIRNTMTPAMLP